MHDSCLIIDISSLSYIISCISILKINSFFVILQKLFILISNTFLYKLPSFYKSKSHNKQRYIKWNEANQQSDKRYKHINQEKKDEAYVVYWHRDQSMFPFLLMQVQVEVAANNYCVVSYSFLEGLSLSAVES